MQRELRSDSGTNDLLNTKLGSSASPATVAAHRQDELHRRQEQTRLLLQYQAQLATLIKQLRQPLSPGQLQQLSQLMTSIGSITTDSTPITNLNRMAATAASASAGADTAMFDNSGNNELPPSLHPLDAASSIINNASSINNNGNSLPMLDQPQLHANDSDQKASNSGSQKRGKPGRKRRRGGASASSTSSSGKKRAVQQLLVSNHGPPDPNQPNTVRTGSSCHQCKSRSQPTNLVYCKQLVQRKSKSIKGNRICRKKYCPRCLRKFYHEDAPRTPEDVALWTCPSCRQKCCCAACRRHRTAKQQKQ
eukprot:TRINITY_DN67520_c4_g1_i2.p1 TRINITY_DN67520_c4_g1~~TRINITY_DN67520_c4_g1_i2.p1  ORF type:complete len:357 (+),score=151.10 TRINITY_DN67520_c4_g1_i2:152-1072(+)